MSQRYRINKWGVSRSAENDVPRVEITADNGGQMVLDGVPVPKVSIIKFDSEHELQWRNEVQKHGGDAKRPFRPHYFVIAPDHPIMLRLYPVSPFAESLPFSLTVARISSAENAEHPYDELLNCAEDILFDRKMLKEFANIKPVPLFQLLVTEGTTSLPALLF